MAWTAPATYSVAEVVTAAKLNTHVRDNLDYLKGNAGVISLGASVDSAGTVRATGFTSPSSGAGAELVYVSNTAYLLGYDRSAPGFRPLIMAGTTLEFDVGATPAGFFDASRNFGVGTVAPQGRLHAISANSFGSAFLDYNGVDATLRTLLPAASVTAVAAIMYAVKSSAGGTTTGITNTVPGGNTDYPDGSGSTLRIAVTAGGALTLQRVVSGTSTFKVALWVVYI